MSEYRVTWENSELTAVVEAKSESEVYGMCGFFFFEQGGSGIMPCPDHVDEVNK